MTKNSPNFCSKLTKLTSQPNRHLISGHLGTNSTLDQRHTTPQHPTCVIPIDESAHLPRIYAPFPRFQVPCHQHSPEGSASPFHPLGISPNDALSQRPVTNQESRRNVGDCVLLPRVFYPGSASAAKCGGEKQASNCNVPTASLVRMTEPEFVKCSESQVCDVRKWTW